MPISIDWRTVVPASPFDKLNFPEISIVFINNESADAIKPLLIPDWHTAGPTLFRTAGLTCRLRQQQRSGPTSTTLRLNGLMPQQTVVLSQFARNRLFPGPTRLDKIQGVTANDFETWINDHQPLDVLDGYAPFCKLWVFENWTDTRVMAVPITRTNRGYLRSAYEARAADELPVLTRWFEGLTGELAPPRAKYLLVIVYDQQQMHKEGDPIDADWGVVGCLGTLAPEETPLAPITMLRNALGVDEGGSGVPIDREAYARAVEFWDRHATWRSRS